MERLESGSTAVNITWFSDNNITDHFTRKPRWTPLNNVWVGMLIFYLIASYLNFNKNDSFPLKMAVLFAFVSIFLRARHWHTHMHAPKHVFSISELQVPFLPYSMAVNINSPQDYLNCPTAINPVEMGCCNHQATSSEVILAFFTLLTKLFFC